MKKNILNILMIEDSKAHQFFLLDIIKNNAPKNINIKIYQAYTFREGVNTIEENTIDIILLDLNLPDSEGEETLSKLLSITSFQIPILILTGTHDDVLEQKLMSKGAQDFLIKGEYNEKSLIKYILHAYERFILVQANNKERSHAEKASLARQNYLITLSHEIRTALNGILGMGNLLIKTNLDEKQKLYTKTIKESGDYLLNLMSDVLDFSKMDAGKMDFQSNTFDLRESIESVLDLFSARSLDNEIELIYQVENGISNTLISDQTRLRQVLANLVSNAIKFTKKGTIIINVEKFKNDQNHKKLLFSVIDDGVGIQQEKVKELFNPYSQIKKENEISNEGTGLGLAICKKIVEGLGGEIWVESTIGVGSRFFFTIEYKIPEIKKDEELKSNFYIGKKALVVDDNEFQQLFLKGVFKNMGLESEHVYTPYKALDLIKENNYDIILLDYILPEMSGLELAKKLREKLGDRIPFILISSMEKEIQPLSENLFNATIRKPLHFKDFQKNIINLLGDQVVSNQPTKKEDSNNLTIDKKSLHILVVDDHRINQLVAQNTLSEIGFYCDVSSSGIEAIEMAKKSTYDVIFMDIHMPIMNGIEATKELRKIYLDKNQITIFALTADVSEGINDKFKNDGFDGVFSKPLISESIEKILLEYLKNKDHLKPSTQLEDNIRLIDDIIYNSLSPALQEKLVQIYFEQSPLAMKNINDHLKNQNLKSLYNEVHGLKGVSSNIGFKAIADICGELQSLSKAEDIEKIKPKIEELKSILEKTRVYFKAA